MQTWRWRTSWYYMTVNPCVSGGDIRVVPPDISCRTPTRQDVRGGRHAKKKNGFFGILKIFAPPYTKSISNTSQLFSDAFCFWKQIKTALFDTLGQLIVRFCWEISTKALQYCKVSSSFRHDISDMQFIDFADFRVSLPFCVGCVVFSLSLFVGECLLFNLFKKKNLYTSSSS